jgi:hypothetical protein
LPRDGHEDVRPPPHPAPYSFEERFHSQRASQRIRSARSDSDENWAETQSLYVPGLAWTAATASNASAGVPPANVAAPTEPTEISVPRRHRYVTPDALIGLLLRILPFPWIARPYGRLRGNGLQDPGLPSFPTPAHPVPAPTALSGHGIADRTENLALPAQNAQVVSSNRGAGRSFRTFRTAPSYGFLPTSPENAPVPLPTGSALDIGEPTARASSPYPELHDLPDYEDTPSPRHATVGVAAAAEATPDEPLSRFVSSAPADGAMRSALTAGGTMVQLQARQERRAQAERMRLQDDLFGLSNPDASVSPVDVDLGRLWWDAPTMLSGRAARR